MYNESGSVASCGMVGILSNHANFMPQVRASLLYAAKQGMAIADVKSADFQSQCGCTKCFSGVLSRMS